jgi:prepilin-type N-terminal cleavage/methylation domain-containing protein
MMNFHKKLQRGDTIVEVLIAMAVLGLVLASAFAISNRSYATGLNAQERNEALKVAESQIELLRIASNATDDSVLDADPDPLATNPLFCIDPAGDDLERINFDDSATVSDQGDLDPSIYPPGCISGTNDRYYISIEQTPDSSGATTGGQIFSVRVYWESILGGVSNIVNHEYRTYNFEGTFSLIAPIINCKEEGADNENEPGECVFTCQDEAGGASNIGSPLPCIYLPASINFVVRKIPPAAGNNTPNCSSAATQNRSGTTIRIDGVSVVTNSASTAAFSDLNTNTLYAATAVSAPNGYELCSTTAAVTTGAPGSSTTDTTSFKIRPVCYSAISGYTSGRTVSYIARGGWARSSWGGGWFYWQGTNYYYTSSGWTVEGQGGRTGSWTYFYGWDSYYVPGSPTYSMVCPS